MLRLVLLNVLLALHVFSDRVLETSLSVPFVVGVALVGSWLGWRNPFAGNSELRVEDSLVYRHTDEGWGDADWGVVRIENGRVVSVTFAAD